MLANVTRDGALALTAVFVSRTNSPVRFDGTQTHGSRTQKARRCGMRTPFSVKPIAQTGACNSSAVAVS